jgi:tRNA threonylcarbamoyladenosine biosynthesis protein TsaE
MEKVCFSESETRAFAADWGRQLKKNSIVCFFGDLGAGKTTFIKGLVEGAAEISSDQVSSPTFVYLNIYQGKTTIYHFDLYRLRDVDEFLSMGFEEYFFAGGLCCIEWSEKIEPLLPPQTIRVAIDHQGESKRCITIEGTW